MYRKSLIKQNKHSLKLTADIGFTLQNKQEAEQAQDSKGQTRHVRNN